MVLMLYSMALKCLRILVKKRLFQTICHSHCFVTNHCFLLLLTVATLIFVAVFIHKIETQSGYISKIPLIEASRYLFVMLMILLITSTIYKYGTKESIIIISFISYGSVMTTILFVLTSYLFGIYVEKFARYNELYGSIGTLLVMMFYVWLNSILVLLGFELNAFIFQLKTKSAEKIN